MIDVAMRDVYGLLTCVQLLLEMSDFSTVFCPYFIEGVVGYCHDNFSGCWFGCGVVIIAKSQCGGWMIQPKLCLGFWHTLLIVVHRPTIRNIWADGRVPIVIF